VNVVDLGLISYADALAMQEAAVEDVLSGGEERLYVLEHLPVITLGRHGGEAFLVRPEAELRAEGIDVVKTSRGGNVTCHFPGQAVIYPVLRLSRRPGGLKQFFHDLEQAAIDALAMLGIPAGRSPGRPGVWTGPRKIASVGVGVRRWVSYHGLALNAGPDLSLFSLMTACGLPGVQMTSVARELESMGRPADGADVRRVKDALVQAFVSLAGR